MRKTKKERTGGLGSQEQFAKFTEIVQEGTEINPEVARNMTGYIESPSIIKGPGKHDETNIKVPQTATQQLTSFGTALGNVVKAKVAYNDGTARRQSARDKKLMDAMSGRIAAENTKWEEERTKTFKTQTLRAKNYLDGDRLNQITKSNPKTGDEEIDWSLMTDREAFQIYNGVDGWMLKGKTPEDINEIYNSLPIAWNRAAQRKWMTDQWNELETEMQTTEGTAKFFIERNKLLNNHKEMTADEMRAELISLIQELDDNPNITPEASDTILDSWVKGIYIQNPHLKSDGVFQSVVEQRLEYAHKLFIRTTIEGTTTWYNNLVKEGVLDIAIAQVYTHKMSGADPIPEDAPWTLEDMPPSYITDTVVDILLSNKVDGADITSPDKITALMKDLDLGTDDGILNSVSEVERDWVFNQIYPVISKRMAQEKAVRRSVTNQVNQSMLLKEIGQPTRKDNGDLKPIDWSEAYPPLTKLTDPTVYGTETTKRKGELIQSLQTRAITIATDITIPLDDRMREGADIFSDENIRGISDGFHNAIGSYAGMSLEDKNNALADEAKVLKNDMLTDYFQNVIKAEADAGRIRFIANLDENEMKNTLDETYNTQFIRSVGDMDSILDGVHRATMMEQQYMSTGDSVLKFETNYLHPLNTSEEDMDKIGVPKKMRDSFLGITQKTWIDTNGITHHRFEEVDPASPVGQSVTEILTTVRDRYAKSKVGGALDRNVGGRAPVNDQDDAVDDILNSSHMMNLSTAAPITHDAHEIPSETIQLKEDIKEADYLKWKGVSQLIPNLNENNKLSNVYKQTLITAMQDPQLFYSLILPMYITDENDKYYVHDIARSCIKADLIDSGNPEYRELGWLFEYLDETLTIAGGELPTDPEERQQYLMTHSTPFDLSTDTMTIIDAAKEYGKTQELIKKDKLNEQVLDAMNDKETDIALKRMFDLTAILLGEGGFLGPFEQPDSFMEAKQNLLDPETSQDFMLEMAIDYVREYQSQGPVDDDGERNDFSLNDWVTMKLNQKMNTEGWGTFVSRGGSALYFVKDPKRYLSGETHRAAFDTLLISYSQMPIVDIPDHNNPLMTYISTDVAPGVVQNTLDSIEQGILDTHVSYMIDDPTFLLKEDGTPSDNEFMSNIWIAHPAVIEFYNTTEDLKLSGEYATRSENSDYTIAANNLLSAINSGAIKIPGTLDEKGNWESHTVLNSPSMIQLDINNYTYKDVVSDWIDITGDFPTQKVYGLIGNEIKTRADVYMYAIDTWRGTLKLPSMHAKFTPLRGDRIRVVPNTELSNAQLGRYRNEPFFRDKKDNETAQEYEYKKQVFTQTKLRDYRMNRNGYPVNLMVTDPSGRNPQSLPTLYRKKKNFINGEWVIKPTSKPVFMINTNHAAVTNELTRQQVKDNPGKGFIMNRITPPHLWGERVAPSKVNIVFPPEVHEQVRGTLKYSPKLLPEWANWMEWVGLAPDIENIKNLPRPDKLGKAPYSNLGFPIERVIYTWDWRPIGDVDNPIVTVKIDDRIYLYSPTISEGTKNLLTTDVN